MRFLLGLLAYLIPSFPIGYLWHLSIFKQRYAELQVYRTDVLIPLGLLSMFMQGAAWSFLYARLFSGQGVMRGAARFFALAAPMAWSFLVLPVAAKHQMSSVAGYMQLETGFVLVHYLVVSPLIALAHARPRPDHGI